jgi:signal transduction histidine kinase
MLKSVSHDASSMRPSTGTHRAPMLARLSLERKLPLIIGGLLLAVILALSLASYAEVRRTAVRVASERLTNVTQQFRDLFQQSSAQMRTNAAKNAGNPTLVEFARTRNPRLRDRALAELRYAGPQAEQVIGSELRDREGAVLLSTVPASIGLDTIQTKDVLPPTEPGDSAVIGGFRRLRDTTVYPVAVPVRGSRDAYVVHWRRIAGSRRSREQITQLIGSDATLFLGNADGARWIDLEGAVSAPPIDLATPRAIQQYDRGPERDRHLASAAHIPGTPWVVAIDFPLENVLAPVDRFVWRMALIAFIALGLALLAGVIVSRRITAPLAQLTDAADAIAGGDYTRRADIKRSDELGRLGNAFSTMAAEVQQSREGLERKVDERTRDLNETLRQLHEAQESLVRREKLAMLGQLASGVGHELRNPLGVMTNAVYYLKMVLGEAPESVKEYLGILQQQITLSEKIVGDLLDFARLKPPQRKPASLAEVTQTQVSRLGDTDGTRIEWEFPPNLPAVFVDHVQIGQIVLNLLTNALQAIEGSGEITIRARADGDQVQYDVADTGPGIPRENLEKIFEPLFTTKARGIGLGLAVSRTLARANSGDLNVASTLGKGATFRLTLPVAEESAAREAGSGMGGER